MLFDQPIATLSWTDFSVNLPGLDEILDPDPLTVTPQTLVSDAIAQMGQTYESQCNLTPNDSSSAEPSPSLRRSSCVLVIEGLRPVGILTERDLVRLSIAGMDLSQVTIAQVMTQPIITLTLSPSQTAYSALALLQQHQMRHLPVVDDQGQLLGVVTHDRICRMLQPAHLLKLRQVAEMMTEQVIHAAPTASILSIAQQMVNHRKSCVVVAETLATHPQTAIPLGIITERDMVQFQRLGLNFAKTEAQTVMSAPLFCLKPTDSLWLAHQEMQRLRVQRLVVAGEQGELRGIVTQTSLLRVFDPVQMASVIEVLEQHLEVRTQELVRTAQQLEQEIIERQLVNATLQESQQQLQAAYEKLEQRVADRTQELVQANILLRESEARMQRLASNVPGMIYQYVLHADGSDAFTYLSPRCRDIYELEPEELLRNFGQVWAMIHSEDGSVPQVNLNSAQQLERVDIEFRLLLPSGCLRWIRTISQPERQPNGDVIWDGLVLDITDRKQAEQKIREQATLLDIASDAIFVRDLEHHILYWNQGAERLYEWQAAEAVGQKTHELLQEDTSQLSEVIQMLLERGEWRGELRKVTKTGKQVIVEARWTLVRDETGQPKSILAVNTDITEKKQLEAQFLRAQRLESIGTLASGIAHDLNNILTPVLAVAQLLPLKLPQCDKSTQHLLKILETNAKRGRDLVAQVLAFARGSDGERTILQAGHLLLEIATIAQQTFPKSIEIRAQVATTELWLVRADATQLHQVAMNLCVNARDAMPEGGTLTIAAENCAVDQTFARMHLDAQVGSYVKITITDTGTGIAPDVLDRIFDPFFTTKEQDRGTGLGLSTVLTIVKNHDGFIDVTTQVGGETSFKVYLPALEQGKELSIATPEYLEGNNELILVVDDEVAIRQTVKAILETHHYRVLVAQDGIEAIALYDQYKDQISVVLLDLMMPCFNGFKLIAMLPKVNPQVHIIAMSGLASNQVKASASDRVQAFLVKPFTTQDLLSTIGQLVCLYRVGEPDH